VMMILFFIVIISGIVGAVVQHYVPRFMTSRVPLETIYEEIPHVRTQLREEADLLAMSVCGPLGETATIIATEEDLSPAAASSDVTTLVEIETEDRQRFKEVYVGKVKPFLENPDAPNMEMTNPQLSGAVFTEMRRLLPATVHPVVDDLENIIEEERQLRRQRVIYQWLHGWLLVHVPLSIVLLVLGGIHAIMALTY